MQIFQALDDKLATNYNVRRAFGELRKANSVKMVELPGYCHFSLAAERDIDVTIFPKLKRFLK